MRARVLKKLLFLLVAAGAIGAGAWAYFRDSNRPEYHTSPLERGTIEETISATGTCNAVVTVQVGSQVSGNIKALYADFNTKVKKDQLVAEIDPAIFQAKVNQAQANLDSAKAGVVNAQAVVQKNEADIASAKANYANQVANVTKANVAAADAKSKLDHDNALFKRGIVSGEERDTAQATYDSAVASVAAAKAQADASLHLIRSVEAQGEVAATQLKAEEAQERQAEAALAQSKIDLEHTKIHAPVEGTVIARSMDVGQTVAASFSAPTIFQIAQDLTKMQVDTSVDEADVGQVRVGQNATFTVDAYPGEVFEGKAVQIRQAPITVQNVVTYDVVIAVSNENLKLLPGMTANVRVLIAKREDVLKMPTAALRVHLEDSGPGKHPGGGKSFSGGKSPGGGKSFSGGKSFGGGGLSSQPGQAKFDEAHPQGATTSVWVLGKDGKPSSAKAKLGISDGNFIEVTGGDLREGAPVITEVISKKTTPRSGGFGGPGGGGSRGPRMF